MANLTHLVPGPRYSEAVIHGKTVYLAGQVADDATLGIEDQTRQTVAAIDKVLAEAKTSKENILTATVYLRDMVDYAGMNSVWDAWMAPHPAPARACVQATMANPSYRVEIMVTAAIP